MTAPADLTFRYGWIDADAALAHLDLGSKSALYRLITDHKLPFGRAGRSYRFRRCDLDEWMQVRGPEAIRAIAS